MRVAIIVFSQTGNTWKVAEAIRGGLLAAGADCRLVPLAAADPRAEDFDLFGIGCPVFYYQEPLNVRAFIEALPYRPGRRGFVFCTHGSIMGTTLLSMAERLEAKGFRILGAHDTYADAFLPFYPHPTYTSGHPDPEDFAAARSFGLALAARHRAGEADGRPAGQGPEPVPAEWVQNAARFSPAYLARIFPPLAIDAGACTKCRECERGCPVGGIAIGADPPRLQQPCIYCWHCVNICPEAAIGADWREQVALAPKLYRRYRYWLDAAASAGRFRWRVDPEQIDFARPYGLQRARAARGRPPRAG
jgi:flavodoxin/ferredoxin